MTKNKIQLAQTVQSNIFANDKRLITAEKVQEVFNDFIDSFQLFGKSFTLLHIADSGLVDASVFGSIQYNDNNDFWIVDEDGQIVKLPTLYQPFNMPNLDSVLAQGNVSDRQVKVKEVVFKGADEVSSTTIKSLATGARTVSMPDKSGTVALIEDLPSEPRIPTLQEVTNKSYKVNNAIEVKELRVTGQSDSARTRILSDATTEYFNILPNKSGTFAMVEDLPQQDNKKTLSLDSVVLGGNAQLISIDDDTFFEIDDDTTVIGEMNFSCLTQDGPIKATLHFSAQVTTPGNEMTMEAVSEVPFCPDNFDVSVEVISYNRIGIKIVNTTGEDKSCKGIGKITYDTFQNLPI